MAAALALCLASACEGVITPSQLTPAAGGGDGEVFQPDVDCPPNANSALPTITPARIRRLTRDEFDRSVSQLLQQTLTPSITYRFPLDTQAGGYTNQSDFLEINQAWADALSAAAEELAQTTVGKLAVLLPCTTTGNDACAQRFIDTFVQSAYRRPVTTEESAALMDVYRAGKTGADFKAGIGLMVQVVFQSPNFLYRTELGDGATTAPTVLTAAETATQMAYLLTGAPPDATLMAATDLLTADGREREARRLLRLPLARKQVSSFFAQWLEIDRLESVSKDPLVYPLFSTALAKSMRQETDAFVEDIVFDGDGKLSTLLTAQHSFIDGSLANLYKLTAPPTPMARVSLDGTQRGGLLTQASVLTATSQRSQHSPVRRGKLVRMRFFCQTISAPPPSLMVVSPAPATTNTTRQRFAAHASENCVGCHKLMDPIGFAFEHFDGIGEFHETENGFTIDAADTLLNTDVDGTFDGATALSNRLAGSASVRACFTQHWQQFGLGRSVASTERCDVASRFARFQKGDEGVTELVVALIRSDEFVHRLAQRN